MKTEQELLNLKRDIDTAKGEVSELKGREKRLMEQLADDWTCKTVKEAEKKITTMEGEITQLDHKIRQGVEELEEKLKRGSMFNIKPYE